jgi:hypothetical protein
MSTGIVAIAAPPRMAINSARTTNVYGRRSASLTIHIRTLAIMDRAKTSAVNYTDPATGSPAGSSSRAVEKV